MNMQADWARLLRIACVMIGKSIPNSRSSIIGRWAAARQ